ncbi:MAG: hypothetical protein ACP5QO_04345 [Clostridia bacterium]
MRGARSRQLLLTAISALVVGLLGLLRIWPAASHITPTGVGHGYYLWSYRHFAYSDLASEYTVRNLYRHPILYIRQYFEYPPGIGIIAWLTAWLPGLPGYLVGNAVLLTAALFGSSLVVIAMRGYRGARPWIYSPLLLLYAVYNWDLLGIFCYGLAALLYGRRRWLASGLFIGMGAATKLFPGILWPFLALALWREGSRAAAYRLTAGTIIGAAAPSLPVVAAGLAAGVPRGSGSALSHFERLMGWQQFLSYNAARGADPGFWQWITYHRWLSIHAIDLITLALVGGAFLGLCLLVYRGTNPVLAAAVLLAWWFLCNKVYSPQYMIWVLYAFSLTDVLSWQVWLLNLAGLLDLGLAMVWLNLGTAGSPLEPLMGIYVAPIVILVRDLSLGLSVRAGYRAARGTAHSRS